MAQRNLRLRDDLKHQIEATARSRGYRSSSAFIIEALEEKLGRREAIESTSEAEARIAADFRRIMRDVRSIHTSVHALYALTDALTKYVATCIIEPPPELLLPARARGKLRYEKLIRAAAKTMTGETPDELRDILQEEGGGSGKSKKVLDKY
jgi:Arc/MetJ-type ribon-helix-helix transcriptional regulator